MLLIAGSLGSNGKANTVRWDLFFCFAFLSALSLGIALAFSIDNFSNSFLYPLSRSESSSSLNLISLVSGVEHTLTMRRASENGMDLVVVFG